MNHYIQLDTGKPCIKPYNGITAAKSLTCINQNHASHITNKLTIKEEFKSAPVVETV